MSRPWAEDHSSMSGGGDVRHGRKRQNLPWPVVDGNCSLVVRMRTLMRLEFPWKMTDGWNGVDGGGRGSRGGN